MPACIPLCSLRESSSRRTCTLPLCLRVALLWYVYQEITGIQLHDTLYPLTALLLSDISPLGIGFEIGLAAVAILLRIHNVASVDPIANFARTEDEIGFPMTLRARYWIPDPSDNEFNVFSGGTGRKWIDLEFAFFGQQIQLKVIRNEQNVCNHQKVRVATS